MPDDDLLMPWTQARKRRSLIQEQGLDKMPDGIKTPGSGRIPGFKRDGRLYDFLVEARTNEKPTVGSYRIERKEFLQLEQEAFQTPPGYLPMIQVTIQDLELAVVKLSVIHDMKRRIMELEGELDARD